MSLYFFLLGRYDVEYKNPKRSIHTCSKIYKYTYTNGSSNRGNNARPIGVAKIIQLGTKGYKKTYLMTNSYPKSSPLLTILMINGQKVIIYSCLLLFMVCDVMPIQ